jgi:hypothetical protein
MYVTSSERVFDGQDPSSWHAILVLAVADPAAEGRN